MAAGVWERVCKRTASSFSGWLRMTGGLCPHTETYLDVLTPTFFGVVPFFLLSGTAQWFFTSPWSCVSYCERAAIRQTGWEGIRPWTVCREIKEIIHCGLPISVYIHFARTMCAPYLGFTIAQFGFGEGSVAGMGLHPGPSLHHLTRLCGLPLFPVPSPNECWDRLQISN